MNQLFIQKVMIVVVIVEILVIIGIVFKNPDLIGYLIKSTEKVKITSDSNNSPSYPPRWGNDPTNFTQLFDGYEIRLPKTVTVHFNWDGLRDYDNITIEKLNNTIRIIALGDSHTFGWGVELEDTWPKQLEGLLNKISKNKNYQVLNLGVAGYGFKDYVIILKKKGLKYKPDIIVVGFHQDDIGSSQLLNDFVRKYKSVHPELELKKAEKEGGIEYYKHIFYNLDYYWKNNIEPSANELYSLSKSYNFSVIFVVGINIMDDESKKKYYQYLANITNTYNFDLVDISPILKNINKDNLILTHADQHPTSFYYKIIAGGIYEFMEKKFN